MKTYIVNVPFDGAKFAARYGLNAIKGDFSMNGHILTVRPDHLITDDPPIFEPPDVAEFAPPGIKVHTMRQAQAKLSPGGKFVVAQDESNCIHVVVDTESLLTHPWITSITLDPGSAAWIVDTKKFKYWSGTAWEKP